MSSLEGETNMASSGQPGSEGMYCLAYLSNSEMSGLEALVCQRLKGLKAVLDEGVERFQLNCGPEMQELLDKNIELKKELEDSRAINNGNIRELKNVKTLYKFTLKKLHMLELLYNKKMQDSRSRNNGNSIRLEMLEVLYNQKLEESRALNRGNVNELQVLHAFYKQEMQLIKDYIMWSLEELADFFKPRIKDLLALFYQRRKELVDIIKFKGPLVECMEFLNQKTKDMADFFNPRIQDLQALYNQKEERLNATIDQKLDDLLVFYEQKCKQIYRSRTSGNWKQSTLRRIREWVGGVCQGLMSGASWSSNEPDTDFV